MLHPPGFTTSGYPATDATMNLTKCVKSSSDPNLLSRLFTRRHGTAGAPGPD